MIHLKLSIGDNMPKVDIETEKGMYEESDTTIVINLYNPITKNQLKLSHINT